MLALPFEAVVQSRSNLAVILVSCWGGRFQNQNPFQTQKDFVASDRMFANGQLFGLYTLWSDDQKKNANLDEAATSAMLLFVDFLKQSCRVLLRLAL